MAVREYPVGWRLLHEIGPFTIEHEIISHTVIRARHVQGARAGFEEQLDVQVAKLRPGLFLSSWQEQDRSTVVALEDFDHGTVRVVITTPEGQLVRLQGALKVIG